ncbi:ParA family protein [Anaerocolumna sp. MB42-C2]|uniref:ParA family protein n=1 Tax=Anaerocolumna sp. MB42-C2 TaxID=3070997 RepID=UPI0027E09079|nr:ParA family protein [Anaerocolumna sp. MB42-C2]WMJ88536.1 ParA family protein [Anaerocolumna sp. MB42-C2]
MCKVTAIVNQKGGVGKTTTASNLGYALAYQGKKVLEIDLDPQGSLTVSLGYDDNDYINITIATLMAMAIEEEKLPDRELYIVKAGNIDLIPCNIELSAIEVSLVNAMSRELILKSIIDEIKEFYDYIIIDCSPSLGMLTINALAACDSVIIPVTPEYLSAKGLELLLKNIIRVKKRLNPKIEIDGILLTMFVERTNLSKDITEMIEVAYGGQIHIFESRVPKSVQVGYSILHNKSVIEYANKNKVSLAYKQFAQEVLERGAAN